MRTALPTMLLLVLSCAFTGCGDVQDRDVYSVQYYVPPRLVETSADPLDPFAERNDSKTLQEIAKEIGIVFDTPGSKLITMRLSFPGFVLCHTEAEHSKIQRYLEEHHKGWRIRTADEVPTRP